MKDNLTKKNEREIIAYINNLFGYPSGRDVLKGIGDDCAVIRKDARSCFLVTTDILVEGVHFDLAWHPPFLLGRKTGAVNLSDIAAMGGRSRFALLSMAFPGTPPAWLGDFLAGFQEILQEYDTILVGGDTVKSSGGFSLSVTIIGETLEDRICYRSGAEQGDLVFVSGFLGDAAAGLALCRSGLPGDESGQWQQLRKAHLDPQPQVELGTILAASGLIHAMIDISDGLATDLAHICTASGTGADIHKKNLPVSSQLRSAAGKLLKPLYEWILNGGEDYQLLFVVSPENAEKLRNLVFEKQGREIYCIGEVNNGPGVFLSDGLRREEVSYRGYDHFTDRKKNSHGR